MDYDATVHIYDTQSGEHISDVRIEPLDIDYLWHYGIFARGSYLCYFDMLNLCVLKVIGRDVQKHDIIFPLEHLVKTSNNFSRSIDHEAFHFDDCQCLGFVAKSNVLLSKFSSKSGSIIVSLDLDAYMSAENEDDKNSSFSLTIADRKLGEQH